MSTPDDLYKNVVRKGLALKSHGSINPKKRRRQRSGEEHPAASPEVGRQEQGERLTNSENDEKYSSVVQDGHETDDETGEDLLITKVLKLENMTSAERTFHLARLKRQKERVEKRTAMTHRERMSRLNEHLSRLSEHFDIPKVGPG